MNAPYRNPLARSLALAAALAGAALAGDEKKIDWRSDDEVRAALDRKGALDSRALTVDEAAIVLHHAMKVNVCLEAGVPRDATVSLSAKDLSWKEILSALASSAGADLGWEVWHKAVVIGPKARARRPAEPQLSEAARAALARPGVLAFSGQKLADVALFLAGTTGATFRPAPGLEDREISIVAANLSLEDEVALLCRANGLALVREGEAHVFREAAKE